MQVGSLEVARAIAHADAHGSAQQPRMPAIRGNSIEVLRDQERVVSEMVERIHGAKQHVAYTMFAADAAGAGRTMLDAFAGAAEHVPVTVMFDQVGSFVAPRTPGRRMVEELREAGVNVGLNGRFGSSGPGTKLGVLEPVDHRKALLVDDAFFAGGMNVAGWFRRWSDTMLRVEGPAAAMMGAHMLGRYNDEGIAVDGGMRDRLLSIADGPVRGAASVQLLPNTPGEALHASDEFLDALDAATDRAWVMTPNVSNPEAADRLVAAAERGVDVRVAVTRGSGMASPMDYLTMSYYDQFLDAGVRMLRQDRMEHSKVQLIDDVARVGSMNLTLRTMVHNHELNVASSDARFVAAIESLFGSVEAASHRITRGHADALPAKVATALRHGLGLRY